MDARTVYTTPSEIGSFTTAHGVRKNPYLKQTRKEATNQLKEIDNFVRHFVRQTSSKNISRKALHCKRFPNALAI